MKIYAISDLHLSFSTDKPMDIFGEKWENYEQKIKDNCNDVINDDDILLIGGDLSWAMKEEDAIKDFEFMSSIKGKKIVVRGNHDYWWKAISSVREMLEKHGIYALQNDSIKIDNVCVCGTRGWVVPERGKTLGEQDQKIYDRELIRLEMALKDAQTKMEEGDRLICLIHFPPFNSSLDDNEFTMLLEKYGVNDVVYGHLHGKIKYSKTSLNKNGVNYYLSSCDKIDFNPIQIP